MNPPSEYYEAQRAREEAALESSSYASIGGVGSRKGKGKKKGGGKGKGKKGKGKKGKGKKGKGKKGSGSALPLPLYTDGTFRYGN